MKKTKKISKIIFVTIVSLFISCNSTSDQDQKSKKENNSTPISFEKVFNLDFEEVARELKVDVSDIEKISRTDLKDYWTYEYCSHPSAKPISRRIIRYLYPKNGDKVAQIFVKFKRRVFFFGPGFVDRMDIIVHYGNGEYYEPKGFGQGSIYRVENYRKCNLSYCNC